MSRSFISIILSLVFIVFTIAPTIIVIIDKSIDVSCFYASSEDEEKGSEKNKDKDVLLFENNTIEDGITLNEIENNLEYRFKKYTKPHLNLIFPPPQLNIS